MISFSLHELLIALNVSPPSLGLFPSVLRFSGLQLDSRKICPNDLFLACPGEQGDGRQYIGQAMEAGATFIVAEKLGLMAFLPDSFSSNAALGNVSSFTSVSHQAKTSSQVQTSPELFFSGTTPLLAIDNLHALIPALLQLGWPLKPGDFQGAARACVAITGTNGKTTTAYFIASAAQKLLPLSTVGLAGTLGLGLFPALEATDNTTPDRLSLQKWLYEVKEAGGAIAVMEASSHGLHQGRMAGLPVNVAVWTNLSQDHLDYHETLAHYFEAKKRCFQFSTLETVIFNLDDASGRALFLSQEFTGKAFTYSAAGNQSADIYCQSVLLTPTGISCRLFLSEAIASHQAPIDLQIPLLGRYNLENFLAALSVLLVMKFPVLESVEALFSTSLPAGRMQKVSVQEVSTQKDTSAQLPSVIVDYAHTPDALDRALVSLRSHTAAKSKLWCVFGCGGDRDTSKRHKMGEVATRLADFVILTSDNPRSEQPDQIMLDIQQGVTLSDKVLAQMEDRAAAIQFAISRASKNDIVLISGKGHEEYQIIGDTVKPFSDVAVARQALMNI